MLDFNYLLRRIISLDVCLLQCQLHIILKDTNIIIEDVWIYLDIDPLIISNI